MNGLKKFIPSSPILIIFHGQLVLINAIWYIYMCNVLFSRKKEIHEKPEKAIFQWLYHSQIYIKEYIPKGPNACLFVTHLY